jgi:hypothetical protein
VKLYTIDGSTVQGLLKGIQNDYLEVESEGSGTTYFRLQNIKGIAKSVKDYQKKSLETSTGTPGLLSELLTELKHQWVTINGQNEFTGILSSIQDDYVMLLGKDEQIILNSLHIEHFNKPGSQAASNETAEKNNEKSDTNTKTANSTESNSAKNTGKSNTGSKTDNSTESDSAKNTGKSNTGSKTDNSTESDSAKNKGNKGGTESQGDNVKDYQKPASTQTKVVEYSIFGPNPDDYYACDRKRKRKKCRKRA